jgi:hypothetical protein
MERADMKRFFKWVGIAIGGLVGLVVLLFVGAAILDLTIYHPNRNVSQFRAYPAPGTTNVDLVSGRKQDGATVTGWRIYIREKGQSGLPRIALVSYDQDIEPRVEWKSPDEANICVDMKQGTISFSPLDNMSMTTTGGGRLDSKLNNVRYLVNHNC